MCAVLGDRFRDAGVLAQLLIFLLCGLSAAVSGGLLTLWYFSALNDAHDLIYELNTIMVLIWLLLAYCRTGNLLSRHRRQVRQCLFR